jgi:hypothetical protein
MRRTSKTPVPSGPCVHRDAWVPEALVFGGPLKVAQADVVCLSCGWSGRVPFAEISAGQER